MKPIPIYDATARVACTIGAEEIPERIELIERLRAHLDRVERTEHGLLLHLPPGEDTEADVRRFAVDEKRCCQFWGFAVEATPPELTLRWDGPPAASDLLDRLHTYLLGDDPLEAIIGLL